MKLRFGLQFRLLFFVIFLILLTFSLLGWFTVNQQRKTLEQAFKERAQDISQTLDASIGTRAELDDREKLQSMIYKLIWINPDILNIGIGLPTLEGLKIIAANDLSLVGQPSDSEGFLVYEKGLTLTKISREPDDSKSLFVSTPIHLAGQRVGIYNIKLSLQHLEESISQTQKQFFFLVIGSIFFIIICLFIVLKREVISPIYKLKEGMVMIGKGNFDYKVETRKKDEIGELARGLNEMNWKLKGLYQGLEERVAERTAQLKEKVKELGKMNEELERFNKLAVGRESKMIELKEEIKRLESELEKIQIQIQKK